MSQNRFLSTHLKIFINLKRYFLIKNIVNFTLDKIEKKKMISQLEFPIEIEKKKIKDPNDFSIESIYSMYMDRIYKRIKE